MKKKLIIICLIQSALIAVSCDEGSSKRYECNPNGVLEPGEACDGNLFRNMTCRDYAPNRPFGSLRCNNRCQVIADDCKATQDIACGDKIKNGNEECDNEDLGGKSCHDVDAKYTDGILKCTSNCTLDTSLCIEKNQCNINGVLEAGEDCDGDLFGGKTCMDIDPSRPEGQLKCDDKCTILTDDCKEKTLFVCGDKIKNGDEQCDGEDFGGKTCHDLDAKYTSGRLNCSKDCKIDMTWCFTGDAGLQSPLPDAESTDEICSNGLNDYKTVDKNGYISEWFDCNNHWCTQLPIVQICASLENTNELCSNGMDDPMKPTGKSIDGNGLVDCEDPSCFKNPRVTVCHETAPVRWEFGAECKDGIDNDGDTLVDCQDPDCLHAGISDCKLGDIKRILFDNAHHQVAGNADWIIDVTGRHPFPSKPAKEDDWHGSLSTWGKELMDTGEFVLETLPQNRVFTYGTGAEQDLKNYHILITTEPSVNYSADEIEAIYQFTSQGGGVFFIADHSSSDRDGNNWDSVKVLNDMTEKLKAKLGKNPFAFSALTNTSMNTLKASVAEGAAEHPIIKGKHGTVSGVASYAGTAFAIEDAEAVKSLMTVEGKPYVIAGKLGKGRFVVVGDSSMAGDSTSSLGVKQNRSGYDDAEFDNKVLLMNAVQWLSATD